jgi:hypothetical protein
MTARHVSAPTPINREIIHDIKFLEHLAQPKLEIVHQRTKFAHYLLGVISLITGPRAGVGAAAVFGASIMSWVAGSDLILCGP